VVPASVKQWTEEAQRRTEAQFSADFPYPFLIGSGPTAQAGPRGARTFRIDLNELNRSIAAARASAIILPVRKRLTTFPSMISFGRTANNDLVVDDPQISKFHASLRFRDDVLEIEDAGSANGTFVRDVQLVKGVPRPLRDGESIRFGTLAFDLYHAAGAWSWLTRGQLR
jgi:hypothetical protein